MNVTDYAGLSLIPDVTAVIPILRQDQWAQDEYLYDVYGIPLDASFVDGFPSILPSNITAGRNLQAGDRGVVVLQEIVANQFGVDVGGTVNILGQNFKVVGIQGRGSYQGLNQYNVTAAYMSLEEAQTITNTTGQATTFHVFANSIDNVGAIANNIKAAYPSLRVELATSVINEALDLQSRANNRMQEVQNTMNQIQSTAIVEISLVVAAQGAIILLIMLYTVRERTREIGILKAIGASNTTILGQFMLEGVLLSLIAGIIGIAIGIVVASPLAYLLLPHLNQIGFDLILTEEGILTSVPPAVTITPQLILLGVGAALLLGALGSLYPAWRAARIRPAEAMRYE
jgi:putative ABC transport system permease protein